MKGKIYESEYEQGVVELLQQNGWQFTPGKTMMRMLTEPLLQGDLRAYLTRHYASRALSEDDLAGIVGRIRNIGGISPFNALSETFRLYRDGYTYSRQGKDDFHLDYIDFDCPSNNTFRAVNQYEMHQGTEVRIPDVVLFINGIPVCIIELKNPTDLGATIRDAHTQITVRYMRDIPTLLKYCPLACISDGSNTRLGSPLSEFEHFYAWKKVNNDDDSAQGLDELETMAKGVFEPTRLLSILRDFVYFPDPIANKSAGVVCRYPQYFGALKLQAHILRELRGYGGQGKGGTYFGATGCGKTYTMLYLARLLLLRSKARLKNPTILIIVDRTDLEDQAAKVFTVAKQFLCDDNVKIFESRENLEREISERATGGVFITTIQKFTESTGLLSNRADIICMSDEAHRTQSNVQGRLKICAEADGCKGTTLGAFVSYGYAKFLRTALPHATFVGFTGTPIDETTKVFGDIVDRYTMREAVKDGITLPINYYPRLIRVYQSKAESDRIEGYYQEKENAGVSPEDVDASKRAMSSMRVIINDDKRLRKLALDVIKDYETRCADKPDLPQKAMITCIDRAVAYKLYKIFKELRPAWCEPRKALDESLLSERELSILPAVAFMNIVATRGRDDPADLYQLLGTNEYRSQLADYFKNENSNFHIAIVVDMWITGFDVPSLTVLYNDKPLERHSLIQTISRVNRRFRSKQEGVIIDYLGIRKNMMAAMQTYGGGDGSSISSSDEEVSEAHQAVLREIEVIKKLLDGLDFSPFFSSDALARLGFLRDAAEYVLARSSKKKGERSLDVVFLGHIKLLRKAFDICHPAGVLDDEEETWAQCLMGVAAYLRKISSTQYDIESMNREVEGMVRKALDTGEVEVVLNDAQKATNIYGEDFMKELSEMKRPHTKFEALVQLMRRAINEYARVNRVRAAHYESLLAATVEAYNTRDELTFVHDVANETITAISDVVEKTIEPLTDKLITLFNEMKAEELKMNELGISFEEKVFYDILLEVRAKHEFEQDFSDEKCIELARKINELIQEVAVHSNFWENHNLRDRIETKLFVLLHREDYPIEWQEETIALVKKQLEARHGRNAG